MACARSLACTHVAVGCVSHSVSLRWLYQTVPLLSSIQLTCHDHTRTPVTHAQVTLAMAHADVMADMEWEAV